MIQPGAATRHFNKKGEQLRDSGNLARYHVVFPESTQGMRLIDSPVVSWEHLPIFQAQIRALADANIGPDGEAVEMMTLYFTPQAQTRWIDLYNYIERGMNPGGEFYYVREYAAKIADNVARLAATFHRFDGNEGQIPIDTLENAIAVSQWFFYEFRRLFSPEFQIPQEQQDANRLEVWIAQQVARAGQLIYFKRNHLLQYAPASLRKKGRLYTALNVLLNKGAIDLFDKGKTGCISLNPNYFTPQQVNYLCNQGGLNK